jgi:hypothetical protein
MDLMWVIIGFGLIFAGAFYFYSKKSSRQLVDLENRLSEKARLEQMAWQEQTQKLEKTLEEDELLIKQLKEKSLSLEISYQFLEKSKIQRDEEFKKQMGVLEQKNFQALHEKEALQQELIQLKEQESLRTQEYNKNVTQLNIIYQNLEKERVRELEFKEAQEKSRLQKLKETWLRHEVEVEQKVKLFCQQFSIEYVDKEKFPFAGKPDNSVKICDEYVVFDSKSPQGEDLSNFPTYIRTQAEAAKKYMKNESVKKDLYFVVPTNAVSGLKETFISLGSFRVHVITLDALQTILIHLKKIEEYEFAEKLSPDERDKIVTVIGKMAHGMKRRIQLDYFMANEYISILTDAENLPEEILKSAQEVEKASKLNPAMEKRSKQIELKSLVKEGEKLLGKVTGQQIHIGPELLTIDSIPLHEGE